MARRTPTERLEEIERVVRSHPDGLSAQEIAQALSDTTSDRTLQDHLNRLVKDGRVIRQSSGRWARYRAPATTAPGTAEAEPAIQLSAGADEIQRLVRRPLAARQPVGYRRAFLEGYRPNQTFYLTAAQRSQLARVATRPVDASQPAGTYARTILNRLLIDLAWNSSRLEGNTYSLLDTRRLIEFGQHAEGRDQAEAQMILNHKDAIEFLAENASEIGFNRHTILNLHGILANNLLADARAAGRLRHIGVGIVRTECRSL